MTGSVQALEGGKAQVREPEWVEVMVTGSALVWAQARGPANLPRASEMG